MPGRGLSVAEKRAKMLEIFHETKNFFQLKELEKLGQKKGVVSQTVKDIVTELVSDGLVKTDKVGSSNFFWSFPSQSGVEMQTQLASAQTTQQTDKAHLAELHATLVSERAARPESASRKDAITRLAQAQKTASGLARELDAYGACDPAKVEEKRRAVLLAREAAERWTDNWSMLLGHVTRQLGVDAEDVRKMVGVDEAYEDIC